MKKFVVIFIALLSVYSCRKKPYPKNTDDTGAAFFFKGTVNGQSERIEAGRDGYYLYSGHQEGDTIDWFTSRLEKSDCGDCGPKLDIRIYNVQDILNTGKILLPGSLDEGPRLFSGSLPVRLILDASFNHPAASYEWTFGDGGSLASDTASHIYNNRGIYDVCLKVKSFNGCESSVCNRFDLTPGAVNAYVTAIADTSALMQFSATASGHAPFEYRWDFGDGNTATTAQPGWTHKYDVPGSYPVKLTVKDAAGRVAVANYNAVTSGDPSSCAANMMSTGVVHFPETLFEKVVITWTDRNGKMFSTDLVAQDANSVFEILQADEYEPNEKGEPTKRLKIRLSCNLSDGEQQIRIDQAEAFIAVSYR